MTSALAPAAANDSGQSFTVFPTEARHHRRPGLPYVVGVHPEVTLAGRRPRLAYLERNLDGEHALGILVHLIRDPECRGTEELRVDQTVRTALGLPVKIEEGGTPCDLLLSSVRVRRRDAFRNGVSRIFGRRYLILRAKPPDPNDIEKRVCRVTSDDLNALGVPEGTRVVLLAVARKEGQLWLNRLSLQALRLDQARLEERRKAEEDQVPEGWGARYRSPSTLLEIDGSDLAPLMLDREDRDRLGIDQVWPVLARRDARSAFFRELQEFGIALLAGLVGIGRLLNPVLSDWGVGRFWQGLVVLVVATAIAFFVVILRLKADLR